jgi:SAM-dependent methyltransferase
MSQIGRHNERMNLRKDIANAPALSYSDTRSDFAVYVLVMRFFCELYSRSEALSRMLDKVNCQQSSKNFVSYKYKEIFGDVADPPTPRHVRWYRRMMPLLSLPRGAKVLDYGGGYGIDALFLAALGYVVFLYELTPGHLAIARAFTERFAETYGPIAIHPVHAGHDEAPNDLDAVMIKEAAHHIEPLQPAFDAAARMLRPGGQLFLLEPNFLNPAIQLHFFRVRGFKTVTRSVDNLGNVTLSGNERIRTVSGWTRHAHAAGFLPCETRYYIPWPGSSSDLVNWQNWLEQAPGLRHLLGSHVTIRYMRQ